MTPERISQKVSFANLPKSFKSYLDLFASINRTARLYCQYKTSSRWIHYKLVHNGIEADLITGDLPQRNINLIERIKKGQVKALIATDVASRGLHISDITHVYNFDLPGEAATMFTELVELLGQGRKVRPTPWSAKTMGRI